jgi:hypothetical protein
MSDTPRPPDHTRHLHPNLPPPGREPADDVERFAAALDALVLGAPAPQIDDRPLAHLTAAAGAIQKRHGSRTTANGPRSATSISQTRKQQIWEELMMHYAPVPEPGTVQPRQQALIDRLQAVMQPWVAVNDQGPEHKRKATTGVLRFVPDLQPLATCALVIAVLIVIGAGFSGIAEPEGPAVTPPASAEGLAGLAGSATPGSPEAEAAAAVPTADPTDEFQQPIPVGDSTCPFEPRPIEEIAAFLRDPGPVTPRAYLPATTPDPAVAEEVARAARTYVACNRAPPINTNRALQTPRFIHEDRANAYFREAGGAADVATPEEREQLASLVLGEDPWASQFMVTELAISRQEADAAFPDAGPNAPPNRVATPAVDLPEQVDLTFRPEQAVQLADGRIAMPEVFLVDPADIETWLSAGDDDAYPGIVWFYIFAKDATRDGQWGLDERLGVCLGNGLCDDFYEDIDPTGDALFPAPATPSASPEVASPPATPTPHATPAARVNRRHAT